MRHSEPDWPKTLEEFRAWHERQPEAWDFIDGVPKLMAPGSMAHPLIKSSTHAALAQAVQGTGCRALVDGAIVEVEGSSLIPDVVVTCRELDFATPRIDEPIIIVEVLSPSNEKDDVGRKLARYLKIPSLRHYLVIHQDRRLNAGTISALPFSPRSPRPTPCAWTYRGSRSRSPRSTRGYRSPDPGRRAPAPRGRTGTRRRGVPHGRFGAHHRASAP